MAVVDDKTPRLGLLLPFTDNFLQDDVERLRDTFGLLDVLVVTRDKTTGKIADDMLSSVIAKLDAQGKLLTAQIPSSVVQKGPDGKIDASLMPSIAVVDTFPVPNEASMLGLQCERGDIAIREDLGKTFILTQMPPSVLSNWRELTSTNVTSVNGQTGAITGLAKSGVNNDITGLNALSGPLRLGGDAAGDYDAVTLKQLRAASGGAGGASMNGVMNNFIGAVEWFNGSRAKLPAGYVVADGQTLNRIDYPDLWAAVSNSVLNSVTEALWNAKTSNARGDFYYNRGGYSQGDGTLATGTTFRVPDLNGGQTGAGSIANAFLCGSAPSLSGNVGQMRESAAPNITGAWSDRRLGTAAPGGDNTFPNNAKGTAVAVGRSNSSNLILLTTSSAGAPADEMTFDASRSDKLYSGSAGELRPNSAVGIWIIRASGLFTAQSTRFNVITGDATRPNNNVSVNGGEFLSQYQIAGADAAMAGFRVLKIIGRVNSTMARISVTDAENIVSGGPQNGTFNFYSNGDFVMGGDINNGGAANIRDRVTGQSFTSTNIYAGMSVGRPPTSGGFNSTVTIAGNVEVKPFSTNILSSSGTWNLTQSFGALQEATSNANLLAHIFTFTDGSAFTRSWRLGNNSIINCPNGAGIDFDHQSTAKVSQMINASDRDLKHEINDYDGDLSLRQIESMDFKTFIMNDDDNNTVRRGIIAQDAEEIDPRYVWHTGKYLALNNNQLLMDALASIKVLSARVAELERAGK